MFKVTHGKVKFKGVLYGPEEEAGDTISGLSLEQEENLAKKGYGEIINPPKSSDKKKDQKNFPNIKEMNVEQVNELIEKTQDIETLYKIMKIEESSKKRTTILKPLREKIEELETVAEEENENQDVNIDFDPDDVIKD
ncbi:MAG: hypothetical protein PWQ82_1185 [Thermosediminibacterales bacterium]|nr:hypothetical protein [Thermosediminibacterales bacterium]